MAWRIVVLGGGFGGLTVARRLERILPNHAAQVTLVSDVNFMLYTPLLPGAAAGTLEPRHVVVPLREELNETELRLGSVVGADPDERVVSVRNAAGEESTLHYDKLVVALGSISRVAPIPGLVEHAVGFKTLADAISLRNRLIENLERAEASENEELRHALLTYVFVGAGYAGVEGIAELQDFAADLLELYPRSRMHGMRFVLVEARDRLMPEIQPSLAEFGAKELRRRGIEVRVSTSLKSVSNDAVVLSDDELIPCATLCWTAGVRASPVLPALGLPLDDQGRLRCDRFLQVQGSNDVWALGDSAAVPDPANKGGFCPPTAQHAVRQAVVAAANVNSSLAGDTRRRAFTYKTSGVFVDLGRHQAVASTLGIKWRGFPAWFLARTYHLLMMPGMKRRLRLVVDWTVGLLFGRDASELGQLGHPRGLGE